MHSRVDAGVILRRRLHDNRMSQADASRIFGKSRAWGSQELFADPKKTLRRMLVDQPAAVEEFARKLGWIDASEMLSELDIFEMPLSTSLLAIPRDEVSPVLNVHKVPVIGMAAAGYGVDLNEVEPIAYDYVDPENYRHGMIILQVDGDSMEASGEVNSLHPGDWIYVDPRSLDLQDNKIYVVYIPGQGVLVKRVRKWPQGWMLTSDNNEYPPFVADEANVIGRVYYRQPKGERL